MLNPVDDAGAASTTDGAAVRRPVREGRRPGDHRRPGRRGAGWCGSSTTTHSYPHCWRCDTPLIYWAKPTWFARTSDAATPSCSARTRRSAGIPSTSSTAASATGWRTTSTGRCPATATGARRCRSGAAAMRPRHVRRVGRRAGRAGRTRPRRPGPAPALRRRRHDHAARSAAGTARRVEPVLDAWFDSGSMPAAQFHYPFEHRRRVRAALPGRLHLRGDRPDPGLVLLAAGGEHAGVRPGPVPQRGVPGPHRRPATARRCRSRGATSSTRGRCCASRGADALRWYFFSPGSPWTTARVSTSGIDETDPPVPRHAVEHRTRSSSPTPTSTAGSRGRAGRRPTHVLDRWIRSRLHRTVAHGHRRARAFDALRGAQALERLVDDLSNWYVRRSRSAVLEVGRPGRPRDAARVPASRSRSCWRRSARSSPTSCTATSRPSSRSVHLADWPDADPSARRRRRSRRRWPWPASSSTLGHAARNDAKIRVRQPLRRALVVLRPGAALSPELGREVADELNVKQLEPVAGPRGAARLHGGAQLPAARPPGGAVDAEAQGRLGASTAPRCAAPCSPRAGRGRRRRRAGRAGPRGRRGPRPGPRGVRPGRGRAAWRWRSTPASTTSCAPRAWPASWSAP